MIFLQTKYKFLATADTKSIWIFGIVMLGFIILLVVGSIMSGRSQGGRGKAQTQRYSKHIFRQMAKSIGLNKVQIEFLEKLVLATKVRQPMLIFSSAGLLDDVLKRGLYSIQNNREMSEEEKEKKISLIFQIKQLIESNFRKKIGIQSTHLVKPGQSVLIMPEHGGQFPSRVLSNLKDMLALLVPTDGAGNELRWKRGTRLKVTFWRDNDAGYSFFTKILGYNFIKGLPALFIQHSKTLRREQKRRFKRRALERPCFFFPISIMEVGTGRRKTKKAVIHERQKYLGTIIDISAGGCSIRTLNPLPKGKLIKINFEIERKVPVVAFGKVQRVRGEKLQGGVMHVMFTRVSSKNLNQIYTYVYNYTLPQASTMKI